MKFLLFNALGAVCLALVNSFFRANPFKWSTTRMLLAMALPTTFGTQYGFANSYRLADSFFQAWFVGMAFTTVAGFLASLFIFSEPIKFVNVLGMVLIIGGAYCLIR